MSAMLTADWFLLGRDTYYRKFEVCPMEWHQRVQLDKSLCAGAQYGGPIAVTRDRTKYVKMQGSAKSTIYIYNGSGQHLSTVELGKSQWSRGKLVNIGWTDREELLCILDDGTVTRYDMQGSYQHSFGIGQRTGSVVVDAQVFSSPQGTGVAVMSAQHKICLVNNVYEPRECQLSEIPRSNIPPSCWTVISSDRRTEVLLARGRDLYILKDKLPCINVLADISHDHYAILAMSTSLNSRHVALYTDAGVLWLGSADLRTKYAEITIPDVLPPQQMTWCGTEAIFMHWNTTVAVISKQSETVSYVYDGAVHLVPEIDGVRVLSATQHELVQRVPDIVQRIFRINSTDPGSFLLEASKQYQRRSHRADEYMMLVKPQLRQAVSHCIEAAGHEFDPDVQKMLIRAAQLGKCSLPDANTQMYVEMCRTLRVLNTVRSSRVSIPLTISQLQYLTHKGLLDRLVSRGHYFLAVEISKWLKLPEEEGIGRVLLHWAKRQVAHAHLDEDVVAKKIAERLSYTRAVPFGEVTEAAVACGRKQLAIKLLEHEPLARRQVPLLLQLSETKPALSKAIDSGDTDLVYTVILRLRDTTPIADFRLMIRNFPVALALYKKLCKDYNHESLLSMQVQEDDFAAQAAHALRESLDPRNALTRETLLFAAQEAFRKKKNELYASLCEETQRLLKFQKGLEDLHKSTFFTGKSLHDTCVILLDKGDIKSADKLRSDFKIPDRRYWWIKSRSFARKDEFGELEKMSKVKKTPAGHGMFVDVCLEFGKKDEAVKYLTRVADDCKVKYYVKAEQFEEAAQIAYGQKDRDALLYVQRRCAGNRALSDKIKSFLAQLGTRK